MLRRFTILILFLSPLLLFSQVRPLEQQEERLVRLIDAKSAKIELINGISYRKVIGPAQFLHNNALILCDSAIWDVQANIIDAIGNVKIIQNSTTLTSDNIKYIADRSVAEVRGQLVEMVDKEKNRLRTHYLDYYTKDSMAMFYNGGCMKNKDGSTIESLNGFYYGKQEKFLFQSKVQMNSDSIQLSADSLAYFANEGKAKFLSNTYAWQNDGFLFAKGGWYDRKAELFHFTKDVYIKTKENEIWADTLNYNKTLAEAELFNNIQILDTAHSSYIFSDYAKFRQKPFKVLLTNRPSVASYSMENGVSDTLFFSADTIDYRTIPKNEVDSATIAQSKSRLDLSKKDAIADMYKNKIVPPKAPANLPANTPNNAPKSSPVNTRGGNKSDKPERPSKGKGAPPAKVLPGPVKDTIPPPSTIKETLLPPVDSLVPKSDSLTHKIDSLKPVVDTTSIKFLYANKNIKLFKSDIQCICDSLRFNSLDSLIRMFKDPVIWTDKNQMTSDSVQVVISNGKLARAELNSSAFVVMQEDSTHFDQIKSADVVAFFKSGELSRFDAFGGVSILFFFAEDSVLTTMNEKECKTMSATFAEKKKIERIRYFESIKSDAYPLYKLAEEKQRLKGFRWMESDRPKNRHDVCNRTIRPSQISFSLSVERPTFMQTGIYFGPKEETKKAGQPADLPISRKPRALTK